MIEFRIDYSEIAGGLVFGPLPPEWERRAQEMDHNKLRDAIEELRDERASYVRKIEELDALIRALEARTVDRDTSVARTVVLQNGEFASSGIAEAATIMIRRANRPLHVRDILNGLQAGGYTFKAQNPIDSVAPVLYAAAKNKKHGLVNKGNNTYSVSDLEKVLAGKL